MIVHKIDRKSPVKFRAWSTASNKMSPGAKTMSEWIELFAKEGDKLLMPASLNSLVWMQYTGLNDANGKEIYEGDIVELDGVSPNVKGRGKVVWVDSNCITCLGFYIETHNFEVGKDKMSACLPHTHTEEMRVIWNIFDNPELLQ